MTKYDSAADTLSHIRQVQNLIFPLMHELGRRMRTHDASKLESPEKEGFDEFTPKLAGLTYGSDEYRETTAAMKPFLDHHYAANFHHPEHFEQGIVGMNLVDLIEMLCDWKAAGMRHTENPGDIMRSIEINQKRFGYSDELAQILRNTVELWDDET